MRVEIASFCSSLHFWRAPSAEIEYKMPHEHFLTIKIKSTFMGGGVWKEENEAEEDLGWRDCNLTSTDEWLACLDPSVYGVAKIEFSISGHNLFVICIGLTHLVVRVLHRRRENCNRELRIANDTHKYKHKEQKNARLLFYHFLEQKQLSTLSTPAKNLLYYGTNTLTLSLLIPWSNAARSIWLTYYSIKRAKDMK